MTQLFQQQQRGCLAPVSAGAPCHMAHGRVPQAAARWTAQRRARCLLMGAASIDAPSLEELPLYNSPATPISTFGFARDFRSKYELGEKIGKGASCTVHLATDLQTQER